MGENNNRFPCSFLGRKNAFGKCECLNGETTWEAESCSCKNLPQAFCNVRVCDLEDIKKCSKPQNGVCETSPDGLLFSSSTTPRCGNLEESTELTIKNDLANHNVESQQKSDPVIYNKSKAPTQYEAKKYDWMLYYKSSQKPFRFNYNWNYKPPTLPPAFDWDQFHYEPPPKFDWPKVDNSFDTYTLPSYTTSSSSGGNTFTFIIAIVIKLTLIGLGIRWCKANREKNQARNELSLATEMPYTEEQQLQFQTTGFMEERFSGDGNETWSNDQPCAQIPFSNMQTINETNSFVQSGNTCIVNVQRLASLNSNADPECYDPPPQYSDIPSTPPPTYEDVKKNQFNSDCD
jgi:hypothetical protein